MKTDKTHSNAKSRSRALVSPRPLEFPTASDSPEMDVLILREHAHTRGRAWDAEDGGADDTDTDVRPRDRDLVDETEDRE